MNFKLTEDQETFRDMVRDFAKKELEPIAQRIDENEEYPFDIVRKLGELGIMGITIDEKYGGSGGTLIDWCIAMEEVAFASAAAAGVTENLIGQEKMTRSIPDMSCPVDSCCDGMDCLPEEHSNHHTFPEKLWAGFKYALVELWGDMAVWFLVGLALAGVITTLVPTEIMTRYLGGGLPAMLIMLAAGIPLYICATASTPIAAALILNGVSPGAALVFLLAGPATNITSLTVLFGILGKRATAIYLTSIAFSAVIFGLALDQIYSFLGISAQAVAGQAADWVPHWAQIIGALILLALSARPVYESIRSRLNTKKNHVHDQACHCPSESSCGL